MICCSRYLGCGFVSLCLITETEGPSKTADVEACHSVIGFNDVMKHVHWFFFKVYGLLVETYFKLLINFRVVVSYFVVLFVRTILFAYFVDNSAIYFIRVYFNKQ